MKTRLALAFTLALTGVACKKSDKKEGGQEGGKTAETGGGKVGGDIIQIDGSSTVFPISQAVAEEFQKEKGGKVTVAVSGTGGGFKKFCRGEIAVAGASRTIKPEEVEACKGGGIEYVEVAVAFDGLAVMVHPKNDWVDHLTVAELKTMWAPEAQGKVTKWSQVRKGWPDKDLHLFGPGVDSGTYDYFTEVINGKSKSSRGDFTSSEDDNVLVQGIAGDEVGAGYFGYAYYIENKDKLKLVPIDGGKGPISPSPETVKDGSYAPLSRKVFIYVSKKAMDSRPEVKAFVDFFLTSGPELVEEVGYIRLPDDEYAAAKKNLNLGS